MKATLLGIYDRGVLANERVHLRATQDLDLSFYAILDTNYITATTISTGNRSVHWFAPKPIKTGQNVVLYTKAGKPNTETRPDGTIYHFIFRGYASPLYSDANACAVLTELMNWMTSAKKL